MNGYDLNKEIKLPPLTVKIDVSESKMSEAREFLMSKLSAANLAGQSPVRARLLDRFIGSIFSPGYTRW